MRPSVLLLGVFVLLCICEYVVAALTVEDVPKLSLKEARAALRERRAECSGCVEKKDFHEKLVDVLLQEKAAGDAETPLDGSILEEDDTSNKAPSAESTIDEETLEGLRGSIRKQKREKDDLMEKLRKAGINAHMFDGNDLSSFEKILGKGNKNRKPANKKQEAKKPVPKRQAVDEDEDSISDEL